MKTRRQGPIQARAAAVPPKGSRVPLSGAIGAALSGDFHLELRGHTHKIEIKARREFCAAMNRLRRSAAAEIGPAAALAVLPVTLLAN
jgi:hypothetical protein